MLLDLSCAATSARMTTKGNFDDMSFVNAKLFPKLSVHCRASPPRGPPLLRWPPPWRAQPPVVAEGLVAADVARCAWRAAAPPTRRDRRQKDRCYRRLRRHQAHRQAIVHEVHHVPINLIELLLAGHA